MHRAVLRLSLIHIYITYTILDFPDLTVDGSFPLGAALSAVLITKGVNPILTLLVTFGAGAFAGMPVSYTHLLTAKKTKRIVGLVSSAMNGHGMFLAKKKRRVCSS